MRCYQVIAKRDGEVVATRIAGTNALAKTTRDELMEQFDLRKKDVEIENAEVPTAKDGLIEYLNELHASHDVTEEGEEE